MLYLWSVLMEDVDAQRKGLVVVFWPRCMKNRIARTCAKQKNKDTSSATTKSNGGSPNHTKYKKRKRNTSYDFDSSIEQTALALPDEDLKWIGKRFFEAIPIRMCAIHICLPDKPCFRMIRYFFLLVMGEKNRTRVKTHQGHGKEVLDSLMGYGIPVNTLPFNELTQTVKTNNQAIFLRVRRKIEAEFYCDTNNSNNYVRVQHSGIVSENSSDESTVSDENSCMSLDMIECPSMNDVIFRAGKSYMSHPGNMMFRELIETHITEHNAASQGRKQKLTWQVIQEVEMKGGRFLEYNRALETWTALTDRGLLRHKIATHFKEYRRKLRASLRSSNAPGSSMVKFEAPDDDRRGKRTKIEV
uniref:DUF6824 domain-containing protein n=1 Tax=Pseudo-nitzschia australis TaxID=44445 RepID=A0A7S4ARV9_9STRA